MLSVIFLGQTIQVDLNQTHLYASPRYKEVYTLRKQIADQLMSNGTLPSFQQHRIGLFEKIDQEWQFLRKTSHLSEGDEIYSLVQPEMNMSIVSKLISEELICYTIYRHNQIYLKLIHHMDTDRYYKEHSTKEWNSLEDCLNGLDLSTEDISAVVHLIEVHRW